MTLLLSNAFPKVNTACLRVILDAHWPRGYAYVVNILQDLLTWHAGGRRTPSVNERPARAW